ncbi:MAG: class I SAM-dependent methyltransferase, partial [Anaerolineae bacterium]|nr:class I SAM-dependent methyltransferase [Anaerolineae bacterium]
PNSTVDFPEPSALQRTMELAGLRNVFYRELMMGAVVIHAGTK